MILRTKLSLGLGFLFLIIFALAFFCAYYVGSLAQDADTILKNNYDSIVYSKNMFSALDEMRTAISTSVLDQDAGKKATDYYLQLFESSRAAFETNLKAEQGNITEIHEKEEVDALVANYGIFTGLSAQAMKGQAAPAVYFGSILPCYEKLKGSIDSINAINMQAVERKSKATQQRAGKVIIYISTIATLCIILAFGYCWYFPLYFSAMVSDYAARMTKLLKKAGIAADIRSDDETYVILQSVKLLEEKMGVEDDAKQK
jgi:hypothetical protein